MTTIEEAVIVDRRTFVAIEEAIRRKHITTIDIDLANAGFQNLIVYGTYYDGANPIVLVAGES